MNWRIFERVFKIEDPCCKRIKNHADDNYDAFRDAHAIAAIDMKKAIAKAIAPAAVDFVTAPIIIESMAAIAIIADITSFTFHPALQQQSLDATPSCHPLPAKT